MSRPLRLAGLALTLLLIVASDVCYAADNSSAAVEGEPSEEAVAASSGPSKRSPLAATAIYGAGPTNQAHHGPPAHYVLRPSDEAQELSPEYLALLQQYLEARQPQQHQQPQPASRARLSALIEQELVRLSERPAPQLAHKHPHQVIPSGIPLEVEQYHVETSPRRPIHQAATPAAHHHHHQHHQQQQLQQAAAQPQLYYPVEEVQIQEEPQQPQAPPPQAPPPPPPQQQQLRYHQAVPVQYGYEDESQLRDQHQSPESIVRAQAQAEAAALAFHKIAQASHYKHQDEALEQIRVANEKHRQQSALEQIRQGEAVSEAGRSERVKPKDPEGAYRARLKAQATALVAEQRRAQEAAEYKAHAEAILKLQAQQRAHLRAQEEAHHYALNFEKNHQRAQAQAQAIANAQALALYKARQQALAKAQQEAKQAAKAQAEARHKDPEKTSVVQYLLPNNVPLPAPEVYLPKAAEALQAQAAQEKRAKKPVHQPPPQQQIQHVLLEEIEPQLLRRLPVKSSPVPSTANEQEQQLAFLVDAGYYGKAPSQPAPHQHEQRALIRPNPEYTAQLQQEVRPQHYQYRQAHIDPEKLALLVPVEPQQLAQQA